MDTQKTSQTGSTRGHKMSARFRWFLALLLQHVSTCHGVYTLFFLVMTTNYAIHLSSGTPDLDFVKFVRALASKNFNECPI